MTALSTCIQNIKRLRHLNSFITEFTSNPFTQSNHTDKDRPLEHLTFSLKDNFAFNNTQTSCSSQFLFDYKPIYTSTVANRILRNGGILLGKNNMDEFAMGTGNMLSNKGDCLNPWTTFNLHPTHSYYQDLIDTIELGDKYDIKRVDHFFSKRFSSIVDDIYQDLRPFLWQQNEGLGMQLDDELADLLYPFITGGSSGGSAVAVLTNQVAFSLGSDTAGSVRLPASYVGVVGFKPTYGAVSRYGLIPLASSTDCPGILARNVDTVKLVFDTINGTDMKDSVTINRNDQKHNQVNLRGLKIGILVELTKPKGEMSITTDYKYYWDKLIGWLNSEGCQLTTIEVPHWKYAGATYYTICAAEVSSNMAKYTGITYGGSNNNRNNLSDFSLADEFCASNRYNSLGTVVRHRIMLGTYFLSHNGRHYYDQATKMRQRIYSEINNILKNCDIILTPTAQGHAPLRETQRKMGPIESLKSDIFLTIASLCGLPSISIPIGLSVAKQMPLGIQLIGDRKNDWLILNIAEKLEKWADFNNKYDTIIRNLC